MQMAGIRVNTLDVASEDCVDDATFSWPLIL